MVAEWDCEWEWKWQKLNQRSDFYSLSSTLFSLSPRQCVGSDDRHVHSFKFIFPNVTKIDEIIIMDEKIIQEPKEFDFFKGEMNNDKTFIIEWSFLVQITSYIAVIIEQNAQFSALTE